MSSNLSNISQICMKKYLYLLALPLLVILVFTHNGQTKTKSYYSGDAINFNDELYITSANSGNIEVLKLDNNNLKLIAKIKNYNAKYNRYDEFVDSKLSVENNQLFVYASSGFSLSKYEIVNDNSFVLISSEQNTSWEWYSRIDKFGDNIVTISDKGINIWNKDLQVINAYSLSNLSNPYNIRSNGQNLILNVQDNHLTVYDKSVRANLVSIPLNYQDSVGNRQSYIDQDNNLYVIDDYYAKKFNLDGKLLASFAHIDQPGFDVSGSGSSNFVYFSNGSGVVKLNKDTLKEGAFAWTGALGGVRGWAMGLKVVDVNGDKVVVFNNSNILVLNSNLKKIASYTATEESAASSLENLSLLTDHNSATPAANIELSGTGYFPNEKLAINFAGTKSNSLADEHGRFTQNLIVPDIANASSTGVDIKVDGENSKLSYSISFTIVK